MKASNQYYHMREELVCLCVSVIRENMFVVDKDTDTDVKEVKEVCVCCVLCVVCLCCFNVCGLCCGVFVMLCVCYKFPLPLLHIQ